MIGFVSRKLNSSSLAPAFTAKEDQVRAEEGGRAKVKRVVAQAATAWRSHCARSRQRATGEPHSPRVCPPPRLPFTLVQHKLCEAVLVFQCFYSGCSGNQGMACLEILLVQLNIMVDLFLRSFCQVKGGGLQQSAGSGSPLIFLWFSISKERSGYSFIFFFLNTALTSYL